MADNGAFGLSRLKSMAVETGHVGASGYKMENLIRSILLCGHLRSDKAMFPAVQEFGVMFGMQDGWLSQTSTPLPAKSTVQRHRFTVDAALCLCVRNKFQVVCLFSCLFRFIYYT